MTIEDFNALLFVVGAGVLITLAFCFVVVGVDGLRGMILRRKHKGFRGKYRAR